MEAVLRTNECLASTNSVKDMKFKLSSDSRFSSILLCQEPKNCLQKSMQQTVFCRPKCLCNLCISCMCNIKDLQDMGICIWGETNAHFSFQWFVLSNQQKSTAVSSAFLVYRLGSKFKGCF